MAFAKDSFFSSDDQFLSSIPFKKQDKYLKIVWVQLQNLSLKKKWISFLILIVFVRKLRKSLKHQDETTP